MGRHRRLTAALAAVSVAALAACAVSAPEPSAPRVVAEYACPEYGPVTAAFLGSDEVRVVVDGRPRLLPRAVSASGARYTDGATLFWDRGREALVAVPGGARVVCTRTKLSR